VSGPLSGLKVLELAGQGPGPFAGMLLADFGAEVVLVERASESAPPWQGLQTDVLRRGRRSLALDLKHADGREVLLDLVAHADVLIESYRPGVAERLGVGPDDCVRRNPRLIYGRVSGWGQSGPLAAAPGHDLNYLALSGLLALIGRPPEPPPPPLDVVGDFGGGGMLLAVGLLAALLERERSGLGQVIDAAMLDGVALLMAGPLSLLAGGMWTEQRGDNMTDGGAPYYDTYETADGRFVSVAALEPRFYRELLARLGLAADEWPQEDRGLWPALRSRLAAVFLTRARDEWTELFAGAETCFAPVLGAREAADDPHLRARGTFVTSDDGLLQPSPAPRFSRTPAELPASPPRRGADGERVLVDWGVSPARVEGLRRSGALG
jgi:alpha-methylacyl-CoA racemase